MLFTVVNPRSPVSEAYRTLRTNIRFSAVDREVKVVMVTSPGPGEGKSTTVSNLAVTYAQADQRVLLIDGDLRKPVLHRIFHVSNRFGLTDLLASNGDPLQAIRPTAIPNLHLITSGPTPPNPSELLGSRRMASIVEELREHYDMILLDTPPVLALTDAQIISSLSDGALLVIDSGKVKHSIALRAKMNLDQVNARVLGVVLNNVTHKEDELYYYYNYYYSSKSD
jgi:capsular exopolysaccharide synthesis family protein